jgi:exodeoxyribonuclease VII large subunit
MKKYNHTVGVVTASFERIEAAKEASIESFYGNPKRMEQLALDWKPERKVYSVAQLNAAIRGLLDAEFSGIWVAGEISGTKQSASGHWYFTLKEQDSQIRCACFRGSARFLKFKPQDGVAVLARGRIDVYEQRGEYQLLVEALEPQGQGALQFAFEQLKRKLAAEGLFDPARKRPLPQFPLRIGIVTSPTGAVIRDIIHVLSRRFPALHVLLYPAQVQGYGSVESVCAGIEYFSEGGWADVVIVARGGGSLEDLWTFNEEAVARAIAASSVPVVSAVGHETDFTIADFVADLRAPTPSAAAELVVRTREQLLDRIAGCAHKLTQCVRYRLATAGRRLHQQGVDRARIVVERAIGRRFQRIDEMDYRLRERTRAILESARRVIDVRDGRLWRLDLRLRFAQAHRRLDTADAAALRAIGTRLARARGALEPLRAQVIGLSPLEVLERGYAIVEDERGRIVKDAAEVAPGEDIRIRLARNRLRARVTERLP